MAELQILSNVLDSLIDNLNVVIETLKDGESSREPSEDFSLQEFWANLGKAVKAVSAEATKLCLVFLEPPYPSATECQPLITGIERATLAIVSIFYSLPKTQGLTLRKSTQSAVLGIVESVQRLVSSVRSNGIQGLQEQRQATGSVWQLSERFTDIPKDNCQVVQVICEQNQALVSDAVKEIEEVQENEGDCWNDLDEAFGEEVQHDNQETWSEADRELIGPSLGLMKASRSCIKKLHGALKKNGQLTTEDSRLQLDDLADRLKVLSPAVDEVASCLYPPIIHSVVYENSEKLMSHLNALLLCVRHSHVSTEEDSAWIEFLLKAVDHNFDKIKDLVTKNA